MMRSREGAWRKISTGRQSLLLKTGVLYRKMLLISVIKGSSVVTILLF